MSEMSPRLKPLTLIQSVANSPASKIPHLVYGTAWKADRTADLVSKAIVNGFRGVDTGLLTPTFLNKIQTIKN